VLNVLPPVAGAVPLDALCVDLEWQLDLRTSQPVAGPAGREHDGERLRGRRLDFGDEVLVPVDRVGADAERSPLAELDVGVLAGLQLLAPDGDFDGAAAGPEVLVPLAVPGARAAEPAEALRG